MFESPGWEVSGWSGISDRGQPQLQTNYMPRNVGWTSIACLLFLFFLFCVINIETFKLLKYFP